MNKATALLGVLLRDFEEWDLPDDYRLALKPHMHSIPMPLYVPWPVEAIPPGGKEIVMSGMTASLDSIIVLGNPPFDTTYEFRPGTGVFVQFWAEPENANVCIDLEALLALSRAGFKTQWEGPSLREILEDAGLKSTP